MTIQPASVRLALRSALATALCLVGGLLVSGAIGELVFNSLPGHSISDPAVGHTLLAAALALLGMLAGGALWGAWLGRLAGARDPRRMAVAGAVGFAPITAVVGLSLSALEPVAVERLGAQLPIARLFTLLFVPSVFLVAAVGAGTLGLGLRDRALAGRLSWRVGLAAAGAFLVVNLLLDGFGWHVGGPGAAERATMLTVMLTSNLGAALAAGAVAGLQLARWPPSGAKRSPDHGILAATPAQTGFNSDVSHDR